MQKGKYGSIELNLEHKLHNSKGYAYVVHFYMPPPRIVPCTL